jgi:hypothetical protein
LVPTYPLVLAGCGPLWAVVLGVAALTEIGAGVVGETRAVVTAAGVVETEPIRDIAASHF